MRHELAWDCGTGNGQAARGWPHFDRVIATDPSQTDPDAVRREKIHYSVAPASRPIPSHSVDLITVAQAALVPFRSFYEEVRRVLADGISRYGVTD
jgi:hypothetical protein